MWSCRQVVALNNMNFRSLTFAAMDTTSGALARILFLLSIHQDVQNKLRQEIRKARKSGDLSYDELVTLPYLDAVCRETLRVYVHCYFLLFSQLNGNWNPGIHPSLLHPERKSPSPSSQISLFMSK